MLTLVTISRKVVLVAAPLAGAWPDRSDLENEASAHQSPIAFEDHF